MDQDNNYEVLLKRSGGEVKTNVGLSPTQHGFHRL